MMRRSIFPPALRLVRLPGHGGPVLRCTGELSVSTAEALRRELALILSLGHPALILELSGCSFLDVDGILTVLRTHEQLLEEGRRLVVVTGTGRIAGFFEELGLSGVLPQFLTEAEARCALRSGSLAGGTTGSGPGVGADRSAPPVDSVSESRERALDQIRAVISTIEAMPVPDEEWRGSAGRPNGGSDEAVPLAHRVAPAGGWTC
jgi:anti-anti-sigma factor